MRNEKTFSMVVTGLGGQGILLISKIIALAAISKFPFVCRTESRGLSQRGGSVSTDIRFGREPMAPVIGPKSSDLIIALDALEGARNVNLLRGDGRMVSNVKFSPPLHLMTEWRIQAKEVSQENELYDRIVRELCALPKVTMVNVQDMNNHQFNPGNLNLLILGCASRYLPIPCSLMRSALTQIVKSEARTSALFAFDAGCKYSELNQPMASTASA